MDKDPFGELKDRSHILEEGSDDDPFAGLYSSPHGDVPVPPVRPPEYSTPRAPGEPPPPMEPDLKWSEVPGKALHNLPASATSAALGMVQPFMHPQQTYEAVKGIGKGAASKARGALGLSRTPEDEKPVDALVDFYKERYGSEEGFKHALAEDPVGVMADLSTFIGGGGSAMARAPSVIGKAGEAVAQAGRAIHPLSVAATATAPALVPFMAAANIPLSLKSGAPLPSLNRALKAGVRGSDDFLEHINNSAHPKEIVDRAHGAVEKLANQRRTDYLTSRAGTAANQAAVDYTDINKALIDAYRSTRHGNQTFLPDAEKAVREIGNRIHAWQRQQSTPTVNYHNLDAVDKLKRYVGDVRSKLPHGSEEEAIVGNVYTAIRDTLAKHDPNYMETMGRYGDASDLLKQLKKTLSVNKDAPVDQTLRKLLLADKQKDGHKGALLKELAKIDPTIPDMIAGHLLSSWVPTGFSGGIGAALSLSPHAIGAGLDYGTLAANALTSSPRVLGNVNYAVGRAAHPTGGLPLMATAPINLLSDAEAAAAAPPDRQEPRPYFGDDEDEARPARATGGRTAGLTADRLIAMAKASRRKIQGRTQAILKQPDEHVVRALKVANNELQG